MPEFIRLHTKRARIYSSLKFHFVSFVFAFEQKAFIHKNFSYQVESIKSKFQNCESKFL